MGRVEGYVSAVPFAFTVSVPCPLRTNPWFSSWQFAPYKHAFQPYGDAGSLDKTELRYGWHRQLLRQFDETFVTLFPHAWHVGLSLTLDFCSITNKHLEDSYVLTSQVLGHGMNGVVEMVEGRHDGRKYARKTLSKRKLSPKEQALLKNETEVLLSVDHPNIVRLENVFETSEDIHLVMEYMGGGELFKHLAQCSRYSEEMAVDLCRMMLSAVAYLHGKRIIHRDLKPENILLCANGYSKLTDFGFAKIIEPGTRTYTLCGTPEYIAPEVLLNKGHGKPVDWWTLGILIYEMICGQPPFCDEDPMGIYQKILAGKVYFPKYFDKNAKALVKKLLVADLSKRFGNLKDGPADILNNKWFSSYDLKEMEEQKIPAPYKPTMKDEHDTSNFEDIPDSKDLPPSVPASQDPFVDW